jgi:hypothetical protein
VVAHEQARAIGLTASDNDKQAYPAVQLRVSAWTKLDDVSLAHEHLRLRVREVEIG